MEFDPVFPTRTGTPIGTSEENRMIQSVGGPNSIRTKIVQNIDGSETMLRTRGGMPEFTVTPKSIPQATSRTFVFRQIGSATSVIANRFGAGLKVIVRGLVSGIVNYAVGTLRTDFQGSWQDVWRTNDLGVKINGKAPAPVVSTFPGYGSTAVPYVADYQAACTGDATRSTLFIGHDTTVASIATDGTEKSSLAAAGTFPPETTAGIRAASDGVFSFYGQQASYEAYATDPRQPLLYLRSSWDKIKAQLTAPFLASQAADSRLMSPAFTDLIPTHHYTGPVNVTTSSGSGDHISGSSIDTTTFVPTSPVTVADYAYTDSGLDLTLTASASGTNNVVSNYGTTDIDRPGPGIAITTSVTTRTRTMQLSVDAKVASPALGDIVAIHSDGEIDESHTAVTVTPGGGSDTYSGTGTTISQSVMVKDFIFADIDEDVFLYLQCDSSHVTTVTDEYPPVAIQTDGTISLKYVLSIRGSMHEFPVGDYTWPSLNRTVVSGEYGAWWPSWALAGVAASGYLPDKALYPPVFFSPPYMSQGNCPFIAYTTKAEEALGATPEFYLDMALLIAPPTRYAPATLAQIAGGIHYTPQNFISALCTYLTGLPPGLWFYDAYAARPPVGTLFSIDVPFKIQFANGVKGVWQSQLGEGFTGYPSMEITRI